MSIDLALKKLPPDARRRYMDLVADIVMARTRLKNGILRAYNFTTRWAYLVLGVALCVAWAQQAPGWIAAGSFNATFTWTAVMMMAVAIARHGYRVTIKGQRTISQRLREIDIDKTGKLAVGTTAQDPG